MLSDEQLKLSLDEQKRTGRKLGRVFVESGYVTEEAISQALAGLLRIPFIDLLAFNPKPGSREVLRRALSLPNLPGELAALAEQHLR